VGGETLGKSFLLGRWHGISNRPVAGSAGALGEQPPGQKQLELGGDGT
jgi:hypothetical protein